MRTIKSSFPTLILSTVVIIGMLGTQLPYPSLFSSSMIAIVDASKQPPTPISSSSSSSSSSENEAKSSTTNSCDGSTTAAESCQINQQPKRSGIGLVLNWGLAKLENILNDRILISDLISAFIAKCDHMFAIMIHSLRDMFVSYETLRKQEIERLSQFDVEFKDLVKLRHKIERKCLYSNNLSPEDQSLCVDRGVAIRDKIQKLLKQRTNSAESIKRYEDMQLWCASYNNWFC